MKKIKDIFQKKKNILNIYVTAGYPKLNDTVSIVKELANNNVDLIEIGMPYSDPLADGPTIQNSSKIALQNGITLALIFQQIQEIRKTVNTPIILMGYYNQLLQYGTDSFFKKAKEVGVNGFIIPDLPIASYQEKYKARCQQLDLAMIFLITPQTETERIQLIDSESTGFVYVVSSFAVTGSKSSIQETQLNYFRKINNLKLKNPTLIGFGISNKKTFNIACEYANGAIIGSAFIKALENSENVMESTQEFIQTIKN